MKNEKSSDFDSVQKAKSKFDYYITMYPNRNYIDTYVASTNRVKTAYNCKTNISVCPLVLKYRIKRRGMIKSQNIRTRDRD